MMVLVTYDVNTETRREKRLHRWQNSARILDSGCRIRCLNVWWTRRS